MQPHASAPLPRWATMRGMKFRFSILTMLVCTATLAVAFAACFWINVPEWTEVTHPAPDTTHETTYLEHSPRISEVTWRMAWAGPLSIGLALGAVWFVRSADMKFRFTIRDLLWLSAFVAVCVAWWLDHRANRYVTTVSEDGQTMTIMDKKTGAQFGLPMPPAIPPEAAAASTAGP
jgi:hypothetical protein